MKAAYIGVRSCGCLFHAVGYLASDPVADTNRIAPDGLLFFSAPVKQVVQCALRHIPFSHQLLPRRRIESGYACNGAVGLDRQARSVGD